MSYQVEIEGFEGQKIEVQPGFLFVRPKLLINGVQAEKGPARNQMLLRRNDGTEVLAKWYLQIFNLDLPRIEIGNESIELGEAVPWYAWVWVFVWPTVFTSDGSWTIFLYAFFSAVMSIRLFRSEQSTAIKYIGSFFISLIALGIYNLLAIMMLSIS